MVATARAPERAHSIRPVNEPVKVSLRLGHDRKPKAVLHDGRWRPVVQVRDAWKVKEGWWAGKEVARLYFELHLRDGSTIAVFQDMDSRQWYSQRL